MPQSCGSQAAGEDTFLIHNWVPLTWLRICTPYTVCYCKPLLAAACDHPTTLYPRTQAELPTIIAAVWHPSTVLCAVSLLLTRPPYWEVARLLPSFAPSTKPLTGPIQDARPGTFPT